MPNEPPFTPPRKKHSVLWWLGGLFLLLLLLFVFQLFGPSPPIIVSRETTYITTPLGPDGRPDYERYVLDMYRDGVTPENNAATLLLQALWPGELDPSQYAAVATELGWDRIPSREDALTRRHDVDRVAAWLQRQDNQRAIQASDRSPESSADFDAIWSNFDPQEIADDILNQATSRPWSSKQFPPLAAWVRKNQKPLELIVEASQRPRCYLPSPSLIDDKSELLVAMLLPCVQSVREAGRALATRAMWHAGENRPDEAWRDLLATHRLARLVAQGPTMIDQLVGIALSNIACDATISMLDQSNLSVEQARQIERDLAALTDFNSMADCFDRLERASYLDAVTRFSRPGGDKRQLDLGVVDGLSYLTYVSVNWNGVLRKGNQYYDRLAAAARLPTPAARQQAFYQIDIDLGQLAADVAAPANLVGAAMSSDARSEAAASIFLSLFLPALEAATNAEDRGNVSVQLTRLAAALAVYRAEHGSYPEKLDDLVPGVLDQLPVDHYNAQPFVYHRTDDGYLLYSAGANGADDAGSNGMMRVLKGQRLDELNTATFESLRPQIPAGADDISVRVPRPAFELPIPPASQ